MRHQRAMTFFNKQSFLEVNMFTSMWKFRVTLSAILMAAFWMAAVPTGAQDLVTVGSITGSSSVFVFRSAARSVRRFVAAVKPTRTKVQRLETVKKVKKQYETIAKATPRREKSTVIDPFKLPKNIRTLPAAEGSRLLAGVAEYYLDKGDYEKAIEFFTDAVTLDDKNSRAKTGFSEALAVKGNDLLVKDQVAAAKNVFLEALKYDPKNSGAYFGLGEVYAELDQYSEAIANYEKSLENDKDLTEIYVPLGILYYQSGEIAKADTLLTKALAFPTASAETQFFLGLVRSAQGRDEEALTAFQKAETLDATLAEAFYYAGESLARLKRPAEAVPHYQKAITLKANYFDAWLGLGEAFYQVKNYPEAIVAYKEALKLKNDNWEVFAGLAESYRQTDDFNSAEANYNLAGLFLTRTKDFSKDTAADLYSKVGYVIGRQCEINIQKFVPCKWPAAVKALQKAVDFGGNSLDNANLGWAYYNSARMDIDAKQPAEARPKLELAKTNLQIALTGSPAIADGVLQNLGAVQIDLGDFRGAIESLKPVVEKRPEWNFSRYALGTAYYKANDFENAAITFRAAVAKDPDNVSYLSSLGFAEVRRKNGKEVRRIIDRLKVLSLADAAQLEKEAKAAKL